MMYRVAHVICDQRIIVEDIPITIGRYLYYIVRKLNGHTAFYNIIHIYICRYKDDYIYVS